MSGRFKRVDNVAGFVLLSVAGGVGLFSMVNKEPDISENPITPVAVVSPAVPDKENGQPLTTNAKPTDPAIRISEDEKLETDKRRSNEATQADDTVFLGGESGTLRCQIPDQKPFDVKWEVNDDRGVVAVNGGRTRGSVTGEWSPGPNKIVYGIDVVIAPEGVPQPFSISDAGTLSVDNGLMGACTTQR